MPVTVKVARHEANLITETRGVDYPKQLLESITMGRQGEIFQSSLDNDAMPPALLGRRNGFVNAATTAYSGHHHLTIRPEDVWLSIISQFSCYVNKNAEDLRGHFVTHEGQKELKIKYECGDRYSVDFSDFALRIKQLISQHIVDEELCAWITPSFSTTTQEDVVVASIMIMGTLQAYFKYAMRIACGIPSVTLLGTREDYEQILERVGKLSTYGQEVAAFEDMLKPIIRRFIRTFDEPDHAEVRSFWEDICDERRGSGFRRYTGWITAFCFWNNKGRRQVSGPGGLSLDGISYGSVNMDNIPSGFTKVPVQIDDNGEIVVAEMLAGSVGVSCTSSGKPSANGIVGLDTMQTHHGWFVYEKAQRRSVLH